MTVNRNPTIARVLFSVVIVPLTLAVGGFAQSPTAIARGGGAYEVSGTYTHVLTDGSFGAPRAMNGWTASGAASMFPFVQLTGEVGGYKKKGLSMYSFLAGPQVKLRVWRLEPFIRTIAGLSRVAGASEFTFAGGGGLDVRWTNRISIRLLQCDYYRFYGGTFSQTDIFRAGAGITFSFGD